MKKRFLAGTALAAIAAVIILFSCNDPSDQHSDNSHNNQQDKTLIVFDNTQGICAVTVYGDYRRREQDKIAEIPAKGLSEEIEWTPGASVPFYFSYMIKLNGIDGFELDFVPAVGKDQREVRIDSGATTRIAIPKLDETLSSPEQLLSNSSYLLIRNNSSSSFKLHRGTIDVPPDGSSLSAVVNVGERARYTINPGASSNYRLLVGADYKAFTGSVSSFEAGHVYSFIFNDNISLVSDTEIIWDNVVKPSPALVEFKNMEQFPVTIYSSLSRQIVFAEIEANGTKQAMVTPSPARAFYPTYHLLYQIDTTSIVNPYDGPPFYASIQADRINQVPVPKLESIEINSAFIVLKNESNVSLLLKEGMVNKSPMGGDSPVINSGQSAAYDVLPGPVSNYSVYSNITIPVAFPAELTEFKRGIIYVFTFNGTAIELDEEKSVLQTIPPAVPDNVQAEVLSNDSVRIAWNEVYGATSYRIYCATGSADASYNHVADTTTLSWTDTGLTAGQLYSYKISALSSGSMESGQSTEVSAFMMSAGNILVNAVTDSSVSLTWNAVSGASGYNVYRSVSENGTYNRINNDTVIGTAFTDTGLAAFTVYYFKICPVSGEAEGMRSNSVSGKTLLAAPLNVRISAVTDSSISIAWNAVNGAGGYNIYRSSSENGTYSKLNSSAITGTAFTDTGLAALTTYYYKVSVVIGNNESVRSNTVFGTTLLLRISAVTADSISIAWNVVNGTSVYNVYRSLSENGPYSKINTGTIAGTTFTDTNVSPYTIVYYYKISIISGGVEGLLSDYVVSVIVVPGNGLVEKLAWLKSNAASNLLYSVKVDTDEYINFHYLSYDGKNGISIILSGDVTMRTINPSGGSGTGSLLSAGTGVTLILDNNITLKGIPNNNSYLVGSSNGGTLIMNAGVKIIDNSHPSSDGGGVHIRGGTFIMNGGEISGNTSGSGGVYIAGTFIMNGGKISGNTGGGVYAYGNFTMNGGEISGNTSSSFGGGVYVYSGDRTFTMNGGKIFGNSARTGGGVYLGIGGTFIMTDGEIYDNEASSTNDTSGGVYISDGTFTMDGGKIYGNNSSSTGGVNVSGTFTMNGGEISGNTGSGFGGGVSASGIFTMNSGKISGNNSSSNGGGVYAYGNFTMNNGEISGNSSYIGGGVYAFATFTMNDGEISGNTTATSSPWGYGGGVHISSNSNFTMEGGKISGNTASGSYPYGGGVCVSSNGTFTMNDGEISGNTALTYGGGVYVSSNGTFTMNDGEISGNTATSRGGGVYVNSGTLTMTGGVIYGNNAPIGGLQNRATNGWALYKYISSTAEYGRFVGTTFSYRGELDTTDTTIRIVNGNLLTE
jgi:fibronectin type 3 domain-containing protein